MDHQFPRRVDQSPEKVAARMRATLDLHRFGVGMKLAQLKEKYPDESIEQIRARLNHWLQSPLSPEEYDRRYG